MTTTMQNTNPKTGLKPWGVYDSDEFPGLTTSDGYYDGYPLGPDGRLFFHRIEAVHEIGDFIFVEALHAAASNVEDKTPKVYFSTFIKNLDARTWNDDDETHHYDMYNTSHIYRSLDGALLHAIAFKHEAQNNSTNAASNSDVAKHFWLMVGGQINEETW